MNDERARECRTARNARVLPRPLTRRSPSGSLDPTSVLRRARSAHFTAPAASHKTRDITVRAGTHGVSLLQQMDVHL